MKIGDRASYRSPGGRLYTYKITAQAESQLNGKKRVKLQSLDNSIEFWVDADRLEQPPPDKPEGGA